MAKLMLLLVFVTLSTSSSSTTNTTTTLISKPGCTEKCGSVEIPYPFGVSAGCYHDRFFELVCNTTMDPPVLKFPKSNVRIVHISLESSEIRIRTLVARDCYNSLGNLTNHSHIYSNTITHSRFPVSSTRNKFVAVGCDTVGLIRGDRGRWYMTGCVSLCNNTGDVKNGSCSGIGCCQMDNIPDRIWDLVMMSRSLGLSTQINHTKVHHFNPCGFVFVAEKGSYDFSTSDLMNLRGKEAFTAVLDWAVTNFTCKQAKRNVTAYACKARHSVCLNANNGPGHRCTCSLGFQGNPYLLHGCQDVDECERSSNSPCIKKCKNLEGGYECSCPEGFKGDGLRNGTGCTKIDGRNYNFVATLSIALGVCSFLLIVLLVGSSWIYWGAKKRRIIRLKEKFFQQNGGLLLQQQLLPNHRDPGGPRETSTGKIFTADELKKATNNFDQSRVVGRGGNGTVYKGVLANNKVVAIKKSRICDQSQIEQFINEVVILSQVNHRNVVKLLGCCLETEVPLLVYEFITNGTVSEHIHSKSGQCSPSSFSWEMRLKILIETARAIAYLHSSASVPIIHRDIKTANILLDENYTAKVSDFGASRLVPIDQTRLTTLVQGTLGYLDPEYFHTSQLTEKSDVYSFAVVLAEVLTGQKALSLDRSERDRNLALYFVSSMKNGQLLRIIDDKVEVRNEGSVIRAMESVADIARRCLRVRGEERPSMKEVASELEGLICKESVHPWERIGRECRDFGPEEATDLLKSSEIHRGININGCCSDTNAGFESLNNEMLDSYRQGR